MKRLLVVALAVMTLATTADAKKRMVNTKGPFTKVVNNSLRAKIADAYTAFVMHGGPASKVTIPAANKKPGAPVWTPVGQLWKQIDVLSRTHLTRENRDLQQALSALRLFKKTFESQSLTPRDQHRIYRGMPAIPKSKIPAVPGLERMFRDVFKAAGWKRPYD